MPHLELVQVRTADGVRLDGVLELAKSTEKRATIPVDAVLAVHGTGSNFYSSAVFEGLTPKLLADGLAVLRVNTRGHDVVSTASTLHGPQRIGSTFERVEECCHDLVAWIEFLSSRGLHSVAVMGHSLGAIKAIYALTHAPHPAAKRLVAISPPRLSYSFYLASERREPFQEHLRTAEEHVNAGRGDALMNINVPLPFLVSAASFLDKYGPDEKYNFLRHLSRVKLPTLLAFGEVELEEVSFRGLPDAVAQSAMPAQSIQVVTVAGANHSYTGRIDELAHKLRPWLAAN